MPSVTKTRSAAKSLKSVLKDKLSKVKKVGKALTLKNGNGHGGAVRLGGKTVVKGAAAKVKVGRPRSPRRRASASTSSAAARPRATRR